MYPATFDYVRAGSVQEAISLLKQHGEDAKIISGGHSLLPIMKLRLSQPAVLIDIARIKDLQGIMSSGGNLVIGAGTTYHAVATSKDVQKAIPMLAEMCSNIGDLQVRNRGTVGGSLAHNDPTADLTAALLALDGSVVAQGPNGSRTIKGGDLLTDLLTTSLAADEIITEVHFPVPGKNTGAAYIKQRNPASGYAVVGVAAVVGLSGGNVSTCRIGITGAASVASRASAAEAALSGGAASADRIAAAAEKASDGLDALGDLHGSPEYRMHLVRVLTKRALTAAAEAAK